MTLSKRRYPDWSSQPEAGGQMPSDSGPDIEEWKHILEESYGAIAEDIAKLREEVGQASDHHAFVRATALGQQFTIPTGPWRSVLVSRPSYAEFHTTGAAYAHDVIGVFDHSVSWLISHHGISVMPYLGWGSFSIEDAGGGAVPSGWAVDVVFTSRLYELMPYVGQ